MGDPPPDVDTSQPHDSEGLTLEEGMSICNTICCVYKFVTGKDNVSDEVIPEVILDSTPSEL